MLRITSNATKRITSQQKKIFKEIAIVNLNGVITVDGGMSSYGMTQLSEYMLSLAKDENIKGFGILGNSGGGSTMAVEIMTDTIAEIRKQNQLIF